ncbi:MAG: glycosyltransferase family 2 protein [Deltaproteobacteria bacterium]|nr:glycosyltransferase family 2 protein [Deltaproteobacteria bacterium]
MKEATKAPLVSVVVVAYDSGEPLQECLGSLFAQDHPRVEVVLVDNASQDGAAEKAARKHGSRIRLVGNRANLGFGGGCNAGIAVSRGEIIGLLNPDAAADRRWVSAAVEAFNRHRDAGMVACRVLDYSDKAKIDTAGHLLYGDGLNRGRGRGEPSDRYEVETEAVCPSGSAGFFRRAAIDAAGGFDAAMFMYGDDIDLGLSIRRTGLRCVYAPDSIACHRFSHAAGPYSALKAYHVERNRILVMLKHFPLAAIAKSPFFTAHRVFWHNVSALTGRGSSGRFTRNGSLFRLYAVMLKAYADAFLLIPHALSERKRLAALDRVGEAEFMRWLSEFGISAKEIAMKD